MKVPNYEQATIVPEKLTKYLLNFDSERGASKAQFFKNCGYKIANFEELKTALLQLIVENDVAEMTTDEYGVDYSVIGFLETKTGNFRLIKTIWTIDIGAQQPRLITAFPYKKIKNHG